ncbi:MAG: DUF4390 domain-containing protein [Chromatiales bacterium]|nr:DUF4390 domain-containing protein [Chromatiales bacterium]
MKQLFLYSVLFILSAIPTSGVVDETVPSDNLTDPITISSLSSAVRDHLIYLSLQAHFELPDFLISAVNTGIELTFIVDIEVLNNRKVLPNKKFIDLQWRKKLHFYALTQHYVVEDLSFNQQANFNSLENALAFLGHYDNVPVIEQTLLASSQATNMRVRIKLSRADLPVLLRLKSYVLYPQPLSSNWYQWSL